MTLEKYEYDTYFRELRDSLRACEGDCKDIVLKIPDFLDLFVELLRETEGVGKEERRMINATIGYTLAPYDVKPEKKDCGPDKLGMEKRMPLWVEERDMRVRNSGDYIDDAFLCTEVLSRLEGRVDEELVNSRWESDEDVFKLAEEMRERLRKELNEETEKVVNKYAGLKKNNVLPV